METITEAKIDLPLFKRGKVRDTYAIDSNLLMVSTDRLSAFDVVFKEGIPYKGAVLNNLSIFWFMQTTDIIRNHFITNAVPASLPAYLHNRSMIVVKADPIPLECVVRGYLTGSAYKDYKKTGNVCGINLPAGLKDGSELEHPIFTPSTKAEKGHDQNITEEEAKKLVGEETYEFVKQKSLELYAFGKGHARKCGLILADTKFEFGYYNNGNGNGGGSRSIILVDEILTPDSSRYWLRDKYEQGVLESLDKQFVRNYLEKTGWNKEPPAPALPVDVIENTTKRYLQAYKMLTGKDMAEQITNAFA